METPCKRICFYSDKNSSLSYDLEDGFIVLHSEIKTWSLSVFKQCLRVLNSLFTEMREKQIYNVIAITPTPEFSKLFGGTSVSSFVFEGKEYEVVIWDLK